MGDRSEENMNTNIYPEQCHSPSRITRKNNTVGTSDNPENVSSLDKSNTIIIRCQQDNSSTTATHIRTCSTCLKRIDVEYYFSWEFMEFCNILCISKFQGLNFKCMYCCHFINNTLFGKFYTRTEKKFTFFCSLSCMEHYNETVKSCSYCHITGNLSSALNSFYGTSRVYFCSEICCELFNGLIKPPKVPQIAKCCVCNQEKSVDIALKHDGVMKHFCAKRCMTAYSFVKLRSGTEQCVTCRNYFSQTVLAKYTVYIENIALIFCSYNCQYIYMLLKGRVVNCSWCQNKRCNFRMIRKFSILSPQSIYICSVNCFKLYECAIFAGSPASAKYARPVDRTKQYVDAEDNLMLNARQDILESTNNVSCSPLSKHVRSKKLLGCQRNVATMCFIPKANKDISVRPDVLNKETQTDGVTLRKIIIPTPVPVYVPTPMAMFSVPVPTAVPFVLPIPIPVFIPITKHSVTNIMNEIETVCNVIPNDPCQAELLKIADVIAEEKVPEIRSEDILENGTCTTDQNLNYKSMLGSEVAQMEQTTFTTTEITGTKRLADNLDVYETKDHKRKFGKFKKITLNSTLGCNALNYWLKNKSRLLQKSKESVLKQDILQMIPDELGLALHLFIQELRKPDGSEYAPDTIYYLCLGIQSYLYENGRTDNIFVDKAYKKFCDVLNNIAEKFNSLYREGSQVIVTRVEEQHLWETKQLGCHSPHILLNTLVYFNTKYYHCSTLEQHMDISFYQILKLRNKKSESKSMMLRYHPKQSQETKRVFEQYANDVDQVRCPLKHYEFYLSKCPESVKASNTLFYLQPEQYCISDSPLWYTNSALAKDALAKMINLVKMVKEVNIEIFTKK